MKLAYFVFHCCFLVVAGRDPGGVRGVRGLQGSLDKFDKGKDDKDEDDKGMMSTGMSASSSSDNGPTTFQCSRKFCPMGTACTLKIDVRASDEFEDCRDDDLLACSCDEEILGFEINSDIQDNDAGRLGCININECLDDSKNVCDKDIPGLPNFKACVDHNRVTNPDEPKYKCICPKGYKEGDIHPDFGPRECVLTCNVDGVCPGEVCIDLDVGGIDCMPVPPTDAPVVPVIDKSCGSAFKPCNLNKQKCANDGTQNCNCEDGYFQTNEGGVCQQEPFSCADNNCDKNAQCQAPTNAQDNEDPGFTCVCNPGFVDVPNAKPGTICDIASDAPSIVPSSQPSSAPATKAPAVFVAAAPQRPITFCQTFTMGCPTNEVCNNAQRGCVCKTGSDRIFTSTNDTQVSDPATYEVKSSDGSIVAIGNFSGEPFCLPGGIYTISVTDSSNAGWELTTSGDGGIFPVLSEPPSDLFQTGDSPFLGGEGSRVVRTLRQTQIRFNSIRPMLRIVPFQCAKSIEHGQLCTIKNWEFLKMKGSCSF